MTKMIFMVFFILQIAPDGPFERAVKQIKQANMGAGESGMSLSSDVTGDSSELTPELLEKLRMQYGLDKPIIIPKIHFPLLLDGVEYGSENRKTIQNSDEAVIKL